MKILQICNKSPYPPKEGGPIAMNLLTQGLLKKNHIVKVLAANTPKYNIDINSIPVGYKQKTNIETVFINTDINPIKAFFNLFSSKSYNVERFISKKFENKIIEILKKDNFDIIQLESLYVAPYISVIRKHSNAKIVLRAHNLEHLIWERLANKCENALKKTYLKLLAKRLKNFEISILDKVDGIASITKYDKDIFVNIGCKVPVIDIPVGFELLNITNIIDNNPENALFHLGSMDWMPNQEAIKWFLDEIMPLVLKYQSNIKLYLAGRNMPEWIKQRNSENIIVVGEIDDAAKFINSKKIMIVPLLSGSGMRVKIIEGMALGKTIISTSIGAEGICYENNKNIIIADTKEAFAGAINYCFENDEYCNNIGENAKKLIAKYYDNDIISANLVEFYNKLLND